MSKVEELSEKKWALLEPILPKRKQRDDGKGRPPRSNREILNGILWILRSGARWKDLPERFPPYQTCHRRFQYWVRTGTLRKLLETLAKDLYDRGNFDLSECYIDATFMVAKKGALGLEKPSAAKVQSSWQWQMALVFLSPFTLRVLRRMNSPLFWTLSKNGFSDNNLFV